jgi:hypothetical protein
MVNKPELTTVDQKIHGSTDTTSLLSIPSVQPRQRVVESPEVTSPLAHAVFLGCLIVPFAIMPYVAITRQLRAIQNSTSDIRASSAFLQRELRAVLLENAVRKDEQTRIRTSLDEMRIQMQALRNDAEKARSEISAYERTALAREQDLAQERRWHRYVHVLRNHKCNYNIHVRDQESILKDIGSSLADVAAFMHEVELRQGLPPGVDQRGIDRIRKLALRLQSSIRRSVRYYYYSLP